MISLTHWNSGANGIRKSRGRLRRLTLLTPSCGRQRPTSSGELADPHREASLVLLPYHATLCIAAYGFLISERERFPLGTKPSLCHQKTSPFRWLSTPRIPRSELNVTSQLRSLLSGSASPVPSLAPSQDARVANAKHIVSSYDIVRLTSLPHIANSGAIYDIMRFTTVG